MISIIGIVIVLGAIAGGYMMEHGKFAVLMQPAELVIIFGAAIGTLVVANPVPTLMKIVSGLTGVLKGTPFTKAFYLDTLKMMYELFTLSRKAGMAKLEEEVDNPDKGQVLNKYPEFLKDRHAVHFLCDTLRHGDLGRCGSAGYRHHDGGRSRGASQGIGRTHRRACDDGGRLARPGHCGCGARRGADHGRSGRPQGSEFGEKVAAALVGTFLGILLCYGIFGPLATAMGKNAEAESVYFGVTAHGSHRLRQGDESHHGGGTGASRDSGRCAPHVPGNGRRVSRWRRRRCEGGIV